MQAGLTQLLVAVLVYFVLVVLLGVIATRRSSRSPEEYFLAGRGLGTLVLFMALFGTNCTTFVLVGIPAESFQHGVAVFGLNAAVVSLGIPLTFWAIGSPARRLARELGALTPAELYAKRLRSNAVGIVLVIAFTLYTIPYMVQAVIGAGITLHQASGGAIEEGLAGLCVLAIALVYTGLGGMRATAWTNVFQGALFLTFMLLAFFFMADGLGGMAAASQRVMERDPDLLRRTDTYLFTPRKWASWGAVISLTVIAFPHMFARLLAARDERALKAVCRLYPLALTLLWVPAVMIGVWGAGVFPELERPDAIFQTMAESYLPAALGTLSLVAVLAVVMSTLDAQILTLSSMFVRDVLGPARAKPRPGQRGGPSEVYLGRGFAVLVAAAVYALSLVWSQESVFDLSRRAFEGYTTIVPTLFLGVRWGRFNRTGALASILAGNAVLISAWCLGDAFPSAGFLPVFWAFSAACAAGFFGSLASAPRVAN